MARVIDRSAYRVGRESLARIGTKQGFEGVDLLKGGIELLVIGGGGENYRHPMMDRSHEVIRLRRDNRTGFEWCSFGLFHGGGS